MPPSSRCSRSTTTPVLIIQGHDYSNIVEREVHESPRNLQLWLAFFPPQNNKLFRVFLSIRFRFFGNSVEAESQEEEEVEETEKKQVSKRFR